MRLFIKFFPLVLLILGGCKPTKTFLSDEKVSRYRFNATDSIVADASIETLIMPYRAKLDGLMNEVIGVSAKELTYNNGESLMGNWACDIILKQVNMYYGKKVDFTAINQGGLRIRSIPKGNITRGKMYELMPFDNALVVLTTDSAGVARFINFMASKGSWPLAGATYEIKSGKAQNIKIGGEILRGGKNYTFCLSDYLANGGDNLDFIKSMQRDDLNKLMRDAFIEGVIDETKKGKILDAQIENRVVKLDN
jgi:2',3'-cyclic-nucleotide 2'-phosphodiesterase (5'-nucleotidase family)